MQLFNPYRKLPFNNLYYPKTRLEAMAQWNKMDDLARQKKTDLHYKGRHHTTLTGREIQIMLSK